MHKKPTSQPATKPSTPTTAVPSTVNGATAQAGHTASAGAETERAPVIAQKVARNHGPVMRKKYPHAT